MGENVLLQQQMAERGLRQAELAQLMNDHVARESGTLGAFSERTVYNLMTGRTRWPQVKTRAALEAVFGCTSKELGFSPPGTKHPVPPEDPMHRRRFLAAAPAAAAAVGVPGLSSRPNAVGKSDVERLRAGLRALAELDNERGGHQDLERASLAGAEAATRLQDRPASQRVRSALYSVAADYTATAAWSCVDARQFDQAQKHLDRALTLAGLAGDSISELRLWNATSMMAYQQRRYPLALAAAQAAQVCGIARRDPFFAALAHARVAIGHAALYDRQAALRYIGHANDALAHAVNDVPRPSWTAFFGTPELHGLTGIIHEHLGEYAKAEGACHRSLAGIPSHFRRNTAMVTARMALAQLYQNEVEPACVTAVQAHTLMAGDPLPGRLRSLLGDFHRGLIKVAPDSRETLEWRDRIRTNEEDHQP
ncbi:XRE family transcriptional regulator [Kitasatospora sp. NPDC058063]|uniref:XRE family transcriptional regulator n=1 Tax=unclassified Kitasatospora TaxID=2633591 RepID=UPI0036DE4FCA